MFFREHGVVYLKLNWRNTMGIPPRIAALLSNLAFSLNKTDTTTTLTEVVICSRNGVPGSKIPDPVPNPGN